jgi:DNA invertase Pin-like site-specific DNA recombinase
MPRPRRLMVAGEAESGPSFVAYYRVSTDRQGVSGLGLEAQQATVGAYVAAAQGKIVISYQEVESGTRNDRPKLALALSACRAQHAVLIVAKLDRLTRDTGFLLSVGRNADDAGVVFCDLPQLPAGPAGKFMLTLFGAVAELERGMISQRTVAALAALKARGVKLGGPNLRQGFDAPASQAGRQAHTARASRHRAAVLPYIDDARKAGATTLQHFADALTARGVRPPMGGERWHASQVRRLLVPPSSPSPAPGEPARARRARRVRRVV